MKNKKKRMIGWVTGIPLLVVFLIIIILLNEPEREGISRAAAYKAAALAVSTRQECEERQGTSHFPVADRKKWYVKYMDLLYDRQMISPELTPADSETAEGRLTFQEAAYIAGQFSKDLEKQVKVTKKKGSQPIPKEEWWKLFEEICRLSEEETIKTETLLIYGTPDNVPEAPPWTAYTNHGTYGFEGLGLASYLDTEIVVLVREGEFIRVVEKLSDDVVYKNVWIFQADESGLAGYIGDITRELPSKKKIRKPEEMENQLADLYLSKGQVRKMVLKKERISGKVLAVKEDSIELEGYGSIELEENFQVYKLYGDFERRSMEDLLVGYNLQEFVAAEGKLCAALLLRTFDAKGIRVLIMDSGFHSIFHETLELEFLSSGVYVIDDKEYGFEAGETMTIHADDEKLARGRIVFRPDHEEKGIRVCSLERSQGTPVYPGILEISREEDKLVLVNELYLEDYLKLVVPSEMPVSYEKEALKAQAVCARTYACRQIQGNACREYGAHVDDSTRFQVYNNIASSAASDQAVNETYGKLLMYGDKMAEAFYFSTSCGHTTDGTIWGAELSSVPYLKGTAVREGGGILDLTDNDAFSQFIKACPEGYESDFAMYRWTTKLGSAQLEKKISDIGKITNITMKQRSTGGIGRVLVIDGTEGSREITGEGQIRSVLGNPELVFVRQNGETFTGWELLPSAFICVEHDQPEEGQETVFTIYGGGYGHGVGMSQNGAQGMAKAGKNYEEILEFFYEGTEVKELS